MKKPEPRGCVGCGQTVFTAGGSRWRFSTAKDLFLPTNPRYVHEITPKGTSVMRGPFCGGCRP